MSDGIRVLLVAHVLGGDIAINAQRSQEATKILQGDDAHSRLAQFEMGAGARVEHPGGDRLTGTIGQATDQDVLTAPHLTVLHLKFLAA